MSDNKRKFLYILAAVIAVVLIIIYRAALPQTVTNVIDTVVSAFENDIIKFLTGAEGWRPVAKHEATDRDNIFTVGYGSTYNWDKKRMVALGDQVDQATAIRWLLIEANKDRDAVNKLVTVPLSENQLVALSSFTYNEGIGSLAKGTGFAGSKMLRLLNAGADKKTVAAEFDRWIYSDGKVNPGLRDNRRPHEKALFLS